MSVTCQVMVLSSKSIIMGHSLGCAGVDSFEVVWQENKVVASGDFDVQALVAKLNKSGKETSVA